MVKMKKEDIKRESFEKYEAVRSSGVTNMFAVSVVCDLSGLSKEEVIAVMDNYEYLDEKFPEVRK